jgi:hypothetical protein
MVDEGANAIRVYGEQKTETAKKNCESQIADTICDSYILCMGNSSILRNYFVNKKINNLY